MYPKQHAAVSGLAVVVFAASRGLAPVSILSWGFLGAAAGVLIDVDHALLSMIVKKRYSKGLKWFRDPVGAVTRPSDFLEDMDYDTLLYHRLASHAVVLGLLLYLKGFFVLLMPVTLGVGVHIVCDIVYDLYNGSYWFQD